MATAEVRFDLAFLEDRIYDADDVLVNGRGQLFVGEVPTDPTTIENLEDLFNQFGLPLDAISGLNITITALPQVTLDAAIAAAGLNPAAGEGAELNNIEPAAGNLNDIEPAAGTESVNCLNDGLSSGGAFNYSFGGTFEDSLAETASCGS